MPTVRVHDVIDVAVQVLDSRAELPSYARMHDAGADLVAIEPAKLAAGGGRALLRTGLAIAIPKGYAGFVLPRSGLAAKHGVTVTNGPGLIDAGYRGEVMVTLVNTDPEHVFCVEAGDRIAQLVVQAVESVSFTVVDALLAQDGENVRATGGFGHSG